MALTRQQLEILRNMTDIGGMEDEVDETLKYSQALGTRGAGVRGNDVGANIGRAGYGIASALGQYKGMKEMPNISGARKTAVQRLIDAMTAQGGGTAGYGAPTTGFGGAPAGMGVQGPAGIGLKIPRRGLGYLDEDYTGG